MNPLTQPDPLIALWQTAATPDPPDILKHLQRSNDLHRRLNRSVLSIAAGLALLFAFEESTGRLNSHGLLSMLWIVGFAAIFFWLPRARCRRADALAMDTVSLLKWMIRRTRKDLVVARCLSAGVPCGALAAYVLAKLAGFGPPLQQGGIASRLAVVQTGVAIVALAAMMASGLILLRARLRQLRELEAKLRSMSQEVKGEV